MLIGIDTRPCSLSLSQFLLIFSFLSIPIELWESTAAIFRQSAGYVYIHHRLNLLYEQKQFIVKCCKKLPR